VSSPADIKEINKKLLRACLKEKREATILALSLMTELSVVTVKSLLGEMIGQGEVFLGGTMPSTGGRPSRRYAYNGDYRHAVAVYGYQRQSRNLLRAMVVNLFGEIVYRKESVEDKVDTAVISALTDDAVSAFPTASVLCLGLPGVETDGEIVINDYRELIGAGLLPHLQERYKMPVYFMNDVNAAVQGRYGRHPDASCECLAGVYFPRIYRPGAGLVMHGKVYEGAKHFAGEIGHLPPGVEWLKLDYSNPEEVAEAVSQLLSLYCRIVAPNRFVLYGDFFTDGSADVIRKRTEALLNGQFEVNVTVSERFEEDFECGMAGMALERLNERIFA